MNRAERKRRALFERGAKALRQAFKVPADWPPDRYGCPICGRIFSADALDDRSLTLEHVPPASLGGKPIALTCKQCNNVAGHTIDAAVKRSADITRIAEALAGRGTTTDVGSVTAAGLTFRGVLTVSEGRLSFEDDWRQDNPANFPALQALAADGFPSGVTFDYRSANLRSEWLAGVGMLRAAYLAAFAKFGYRYAFDPRLEIVRKQIQQPDVPMISGCWLDPDDVDVRSEQPLYIAIFPKPVPCVLVRIKYHGVLLPWIEGPAWSYPFPVEGGLQLQEGGRWPWPAGMELLLDLRECESHVPEDHPIG